MHVSRARVHARFQMEYTLEGWAFNSVHANVVYFGHHSVWFQLKDFDDAKLNWVCTCCNASVEFRQSLYC